ncbi:universal stress protein [Corynebacterium glucuronolyticum]|uniref:universal stress protein n=1 Tax=Corynebacterium glucuronolyticum TaxID=39791 RepID=UPI003F6DB871
MRRKKSVRGHYRPTTGRFLVAYQATRAGKAGMKLAISLAAGRDIGLEIVSVEPRDDSYSGVWVGDSGYDVVITNQLQKWLRQALDEVPLDIPARARIVTGENEADAISRAAEQLSCDAIIIGSRAHRVLNRVTMGATVDALLHSATRPVAIAPPGYHYTGEVTRITAMFGPRHGCNDVVALCMDRAQRRGIPARLVSLMVKEDKRLLKRLRKSPPKNTVAALSAYTEEFLAELATEAIEEGDVAVATAAGASVAEAVKELTFVPGEMVIIGSSRLAVHGRIFLGTTGAQLLHCIPVPLMIVPAGYMTGKEATGGEG